MSGPFGDRFYALTRLTMKNILIGAAVVAALMLLAQYLEEN
jgi:hypothetical protein